MAKKSRASKPVDWLQNWQPFIWDGLNNDQIRLEKKEVENLVQTFLNESDQGKQAVNPRARPHTIKFIWHKGIEDPSSFIVVGYLTPGATITIAPGSGNGVINPTPPPQP
jgi:hypothetical protein